MAVTPEACARIDAVVSGVRRGGGVVSVSARAASQVVYEHDPDAQHYAASVMKLPLLVAAHRLAERGLLDLDRTLEVHDEFASVLAGHRFAMDPAEDSDPQTWAALGYAVRLGDLVERMVTVSGNLATNLVLEQVGTGEVASVLATAGCSVRTTLPRGIEDYPARDAGIDNLITAGDLARVVVALAEGALAGPDASGDAERTLRAQTYRDGIPAGLPGDLLVGNKTGWIDGVNHDVALVRSTERPPLALAVLVSVPAAPEDREAGIARISAAVWKEWTG